jgi:hypothetical protein
VSDKGTDEEEKHPAKGVKRCARTAQALIRDEKSESEMRFPERAIKISGSAPEASVNKIRKPKRVDPTVKMPVESGKVQSTAGHP